MSFIRWGGLAGLAALLAAAPAARAEVRPHNLFSDHMVLQRDREVPIWGTARDGERVTVKLNGRSASTTARDGRWMVRLKPMKAGGPHTMTISGDNRITIQDLLIGEVWIASGQSNMQWTVRQSADPDRVLAGADQPKIRLFDVPRKAADTPQDQVDARWTLSNRETVANFSAVAWHFGVNLQKSLGVPVGLINTSYGGTPAEAWTRHEVLASTPGLEGVLQRYDAVLRGYPAQYAAYRAALTKHRFDSARARAEGRPVPPAPRMPSGPQNPQRPSGLYNAMIKPLIPYAFRGAIWYQGESNAGRAHEYFTLFPVMIRNWRDDWGQGDFPFLFVQLAPFMKKKSEPGESSWAELREAQRQTVKTTPNTAMAVITDVGDEDDIHPRQKGPVGERLAFAARRLVYGEEIPYSGPDPRLVELGNGQAVIHFDHTAGGLEARGGELTGFTIAGADGRWRPATARIEGNRVIVRSSEVPEPVAVRYGWADFPQGNLWNRAGLPASPFRTDNFRLTTVPLP